MKRILKRKHLNLYRTDVYAERRKGAAAKFRAGPGKFLSWAVNVRPAYPCKGLGTLKASNDMQAAQFWKEVGAKSKDR
jgi:hypothetical protein